MAVMDELRWELDAFAEQWAVCLITGDFEPLQKSYAEDCKLLRPNAPPIVGSADLISMLEGLHKAGWRMAEYSVEETGGPDEQPWFWWTFKYRDETGKVVEKRAGKSFFLFNRVDGKLMVHLMIWNLNQ